MNTTFREVTLILLCTLLAGVGTHFLHPRAPAWNQISEPLREDEVTMQTIREKWQGDVLWIDARTRAEYEAAHIPNALLLNEQEVNELLFQHFEKLQDNTKPVIIYCGSESCQASRKMKEYLIERLTVDNIYLLRGGWAAWQAAQKN